MRMFDRALCFCLKKAIEVNTCSGVLALNNRKCVESWFYLVRNVVVHYQNNMTILALQLLVPFV